MEKKETPIVQMGTDRAATPKSPTYEQLQAKIVELVRQCQAQQQQLELANSVIGNKQLDYLFKVIENGAMFETEFVNYCVTQIQSVIWQKEEEPEPNEE